MNSSSLGAIVGLVGLLVIVGLAVMAPLTLIFTWPFLIGFTVLTIRLNRSNKQPMTDRSTKDQHLSGVIVLILTGVVVAGLLFGISLNQFCTTECTESVKRWDMISRIAILLIGSGGGYLGYKLLKNR